jgi:hypothetical protein
VVGDKTVGYAMERFEMSLREHINTNGMDSKMEEKVYELIKGVCAVVSCFDVMSARVVSWVGCADQFFFRWTLQGRQPVGPDLHF